ncbi:alpha/beta fold hydrolase [Actinokineospora sp. G85]|uniref:alpha/beta fold hydrolase n=1 Tax=Actinokineospora sp. G85 TaxID=3406626 RepID=UPI003C747A48
MSTYVLVPGAGSDSAHWSRVRPLLAARGHEVITPDLAVADPEAGLDAYVDTIVEAIGDRSGVILVAHSMGALSASVAAARADVALLVLVAAMIPAPGETGGRWWAATGQPEAQRAADLAAGRDPDAPFDPLVTFLHDLPPDALDEVLAAPLIDQSDRPFADPWPLAAWPDVPTRVLVCRDDRLFPLEFQRRVTRERLGITPDEMEGGHMPALAHPHALVEWLERYRTSG